MMEDRVDEYMNAIRCRKTVRNGSRSSPWSVDGVKQRWENRGMIEIPVRDSCKGALTPLWREMRPKLPTWA